MEMICSSPPFRSPMTSAPPPATARLAWPPLIDGTLIRRYKRFLADVRLADGTTVTAHCPNSGSMAECSEPDRPVRLSSHDNPRRKLPYTWEVIEMPTSPVGVNTLVPNRLTALALSAGLIPALADYRRVRREVAVGNRTRIDILAETEAGDRCYVEVKNCTLVTDGLARFPDAVTSRGRKHLEVLSGLRADGHRCVNFYLIQRMDADRFAPADDIDPAYGEALRRAVAAGVEALAYDVIIDRQGIALHRRLPVDLAVTPTADPTRNGGP